MKKEMFRFRLQDKGQSFTELAIVLGVLLLLLTGMVEFGNLLNQYINLIDGVREGARYGSNNDPFLNPVTYVDDYSAPQESFFENIDAVIEGDTDIPVSQRTSAIAPVVLDPVTAGFRTNGEEIIPDDILIRFYGVSGTAITGKFPAAKPWCKYCTPGQTSRITETQIQDYLEANAPPTGILVVEIFYNYHQLLRLPLFTTVIPDPIPVHTYAIMPLSGAEATPGP